MAAETSSVTLELHGPLAQRFAELGRRHGARTRVDIQARAGETVGDFLARLVAAEPRFELLYEPQTERVPEHVEAVLNDRVLDLQGGLEAHLSPGDVLSFLPAHAGGFF
jgi:molybdopterin converting factor small subunit